MENLKIGDIVYDSLDIEDGLFEVVSIHQDGKIDITDYRRGLLDRIKPDRFVKFSLPIEIREKSIQDFFNELNLEGKRLFNALL